MTSSRRSSIASTPKKKKTSKKKKSSSPNGESVVVAVRVRPLNPREKNNHESSIITMNGSQTILKNPDTGKEYRYTFDHSYWSFNADDDHFVPQAQIFEDLGVSVLKNAFSGYNASLFAYGQTGSGKTFSTYGNSQDPGIVPRLCDTIFEKISAKKEKSPSSTFRVEASMLEIYAERVRDLLDPTNPGNENGLRVRENQQTGPYVEGLSWSIASNGQDLAQLFDEGAKMRTIASTSMNATSSRAHTIFQIILTQSKKIGSKNAQKKSIISLIDLAGSERQSKAQTTGDRLKEGAAINLSLSMLGNVITKLAENSSRTRAEFVPYRNSTLTWLLKESLGGNSKTIMLAAISPAASNFEETLSTLRYANSAKNIKNHARVNEDATSKIINDLKTQIDQLQSQLSQSGRPGSALDENRQLRDQISEYERIIDSYKMSDQQRMEQAEMMKKARHQYMEQAGLIIAERREVPHMVNLNDDAMMNECLIYFFVKDKMTRIGSDRDNDIVLSDEAMKEKHCFVENNDNQEIFITPHENAPVFINGKRIHERTEMFSSDRLIIGSTHVFRFSNPQKPSTDKRVIDIDLAKQEIQNALDEEFQQKRAEQENELQEEFMAKRSQKEEQIQMLEIKRQELLEQIRRTQEEQLAEVENSQQSAKSAQILEMDVKKFQEQLAMEQERKKNLEVETSRRAQEVESMRRNVDGLKNQLKNQEEQTRVLHEQFEKEKIALQEESKKYLDETEKLNARIQEIEEEKQRYDQERSTLMSSVQQHKQAQQESEENYNRALREQSELLPTLQKMMIEQEQQYRKQINSLNERLTKQLMQIDQLNEELSKNKSSNVNQQSEYLAQLIEENERLRYEINQVRNQQQNTGQSPHANQQMKQLQMEVYKLRNDKIELERAKIQLEVENHKKQKIIHSLTQQNHGSYSPHQQHYPREGGGGSYPQQHPQQHPQHQYNHRR